MRAVFVSDGKILTTGFSRMSERQVALWDMVSEGMEQKIKKRGLVSALSPAWLRAHGRVYPR